MRIGGAVLQFPQHVFMASCLTEGKQHICLSTFFLLKGILIYIQGSISVLQENKHSN